MKSSQFKAFQDKAFEAFVQEQSQKNENEIFSIEYEGKKYWVKKGRKTSSNLFHHLCYKLLPFEFLMPVEKKTPVQAIAFESNKLIEFKRHGINVPEVIGANEKFFVMSDCGEQVYVKLRQEKLDEQALKKLLEKYVNEVAKIHNLGFYHGGAQSRNFTFKDNRVFAIDLEDSFDVNIDIKTLQFRDLLLMLISMSKVDMIEIYYQEIIEQYIKQTGRTSSLLKLQQLSSKLNFLTKLNETSYLEPKLPNDVKEFCKLLKELNKLSS